MKHKIDNEKLYYAVLKLVSPLKPVSVQTVDAIVFINPEDISYITTSKAGLEIVDIKGKSWKRFDTINEIAKQLAADPMFFKASRSDIINLRQVNALYTTSTGAHEISFKTLPQDIKRPIADSSYKEFKKAMGIITSEPETNENTNK